MKRVIIPLAFPAMTGAENGEVEFEISEPGEIIDCLIQVKPKVGGIVMAQNAGKPDFELIPTMMVVIDPDTTPRKRKFLVTQPMLVVESEGTLAYQGRFLFPDGKMLVVFEEIVESKWMHPDAYGHGKPLTLCRRCGKGVGHWTGPDEGPCRCTQQEMEEFMSSKLIITK